MPADKTSAPSATPRRMPAECVGGCPPNQVCDFCQYREALPSHVDPFMAGMPQPEKDAVTVRYEERANVAERDEWFHRDVSCRNPGGCHIQTNACAEVGRCLSAAPSSTRPLTREQIERMRSVLIESMTDSEGEYPEEVETIVDMALKWIEHGEAKSATYTRNTPEDPKRG